MPRSGTLSKDRLLFVSVDDLDLETKVVGMLRALDLEYLGQVASQSPERFLELERYGRKTVELLESKLQSLGVGFGDAPEEWADLTPQEFREQYGAEIRSARKEFATKTQISSSLEDDFRNLMAAEKNLRNKELIAARYGWSGNPPATLQEIGARFGSLTRERVRQICSRFENKISSKQIVLPSVAKALALCADAAPASDAALGELLVREGIATKIHTIEGLLNAANFAKLKAKIERANPPFGHLYVPVGGADIPIKAIRYARRQMSSRGATNLLQLSNYVSEEIGIDIAPDALEEIIKEQPGFVRFDDFPGWFWILTSRNRLVNVLKKIFAVADRLHVSEVRSAVQRFGRLEGFAPPQRVLLGLADQVSELEAKNEFICRKAGVSTDGWIEGTEATLFAVLSKAGGVMDRMSLTRECLAMGMNEITCQIYLSNSPILQNLGRGVFALIGAEYDEQSVRQYQRPTGLRPVVDFSWTLEGNIRVRYRVTEHMLFTGFIPVPAQFSGYISKQEFQIHDANGQPLGAILKTNEGQAWGLKKLLNAMGAEIGDPFEICFDLGKKIATMSFGELAEDD